MKFSKSKAAKEIEKAFAAQAAATPVAPFDLAGLDREVERMRQRHADRAARKLELETALEGEGHQPVAAATVVPAVQEFLAAMAKRVRVATPEEERAFILKQSILPRLGEWGFEKRFRREIKDFNCPEQQATYEVCRQRLLGVGAVIALIGKRGAGKTTIAAQLAVDRAWRERAGRESGKPGLIVSFVYRKLTALVQRFKPLYANFGSVDTEKLLQSMERRCKEDDVLVIDEMHDLGELAVREALLIDVIDRRYAAQLDTLLISNQTPEEWDAQTPPSIQSRIQEHGCVLKCEWDSWREKGSDA